MSEIQRVVNVIRGRLSENSTCTVLKNHRCKNKATHMLFCDDGRTSMSRLYSTSCEKHLAKAIDKGWELNKEADEQYKINKQKMLEEELNKLKASTNKVTG